MSVVTFEPEMSKEEIADCEAKIEELQFFLKSFESKLQYLESHLFSYEDDDEEPTSSFTGYDRDSHMMMNEYEELREYLGEYEDEIERLIDTINMSKAVKKNSVPILAKDDYRC